ncbi:hypothetical protein GCM10023116_30690 [Kistimonas scapharcae]|uniref:NADAR domain-containing protein n=2 Tax=Kistimonas scapharcae TaxID=1036133 RepID=A0ABP8V4C6_9GAMM
MLKLVRTRAQQDAEFRRELLATGDKWLFEVTRGDKIWGCTYDSETGQYVGKNYLGRILMQVREELRQQKIPQMLAGEVYDSQGFGNFS